jgi:hypothetical protein
MHKWFFIIALLICNVCFPAESPPRASAELCRVPAWEALLEL